MKKVLSAVILAIVIAAGLGAAHWYLNMRPDASAARKGSFGGGGGISVEAVKVKIAAVVDEVSAVGTLRSNESVVIRPEIAGRIAEINFDEGEPARRGATLVRFDDSTYKAELANAQASLNLTQNNFRRQDELFQKGSTTARERDEALARLESARATLRLAEARFEKTYVNAPFSGILGLRRVSPGDYVTPGQDLVNLEDIDTIKVDFRIPERFLASLKTGQRIRVRVDAFPDRAFDGEVYAIDPLIDAAGRSIAIRARIANSEQILRPGLFARVRLIVDERPAALLVPEQAIVPRGEQRNVFRVVDGKATLTEVGVGQSRAGEVEIVTGLTKEDVVITAGQLKIRDGTAVTIQGQEPTISGDAAQKDGAT